MLLTIYIFVAILGGVMLAASSFASDSRESIEAPAPDQPLPQDPAGLAARLTSVRFWGVLFVVAGAGAMAAIWLGLGGPRWVPPLVGLVAGALGAYALSPVLDAFAGKEPEPWADSSEGMVGQRATVLSQVARGKQGMVRLDLDGATFDVSAATDEMQPLEVH